MTYADLQLHVFGLATVEPPLSEGLIHQVLMDKPGYNSARVSADILTARSTKKAEHEFRLNRKPESDLPPCVTPPAVQALVDTQRAILDALAEGALSVDALAAGVGCYVDANLWRSAVETLTGTGMIRVHNAQAELVPRTIFPTNKEHETTWKHWEYFKGVEA